MAQPWSDPGRDILGDIWETWVGGHERAFYPPDHPSGPRAIHHFDYAHPLGSSDHSPWPEIIDEAAEWKAKSTWLLGEIPAGSPECPSDLLPELSRASRSTHALERAVLADRHAVLRRRIGK